MEETGKNDTCEGNYAVLGKYLCGMESLAAETAILEICTQHETKFIVMHSGP